MSRLKTPENERLLNPTKNGQLGSQDDFPWLNGWFKRGMVGHVMQRFFSTYQLLVGFCRWKLLPIATTTFMK